MRMVTTVPQAEALWQEYRQGGDAGARQELILRYLPLVRIIVSRLPVRLPAHLDREDLLSYGVFGLISALERFDPSRGVKFETFASQRIRGAILDALRQNSWLPRSVSDRLRQLNAAYQRLEQEGKDDPETEELAAAAGMARDEVEDLLAQTICLSWVSLEEFLGDREGEGARRVADTLADGDSPDPVRSYEEEELRQALVQALENLGEKDRLVLTMYYYEEMTLKEIGQVLGVSESRVSQLHARALLRLRQSLRDFVSGG